MEKICEIKEILIDLIYDVVTSDLSEVCAKELGEIVDVLKDMNQYLYYDAVIDAMENREDTISSDVRSRMYYNNPEVETAEEVISIMGKIASNMDATEKVKMKQQFITAVNQL